MRTLNCGLQIADCGLPTTAPVSTSLRGAQRRSNLSAGTTPAKSVACSAPWAERRRLSSLRTITRGSKTRATSRRSPSIRILQSAIRNRSSGFSLIEILIAMFVFLVGVLGVLSLFPVAMVAAGRAVGEVRSNVMSQSLLAQVAADVHAPIESGAANGDPLAYPIPNPSHELKRAVNAGAGTNRSGLFVTLTSGPGKWQSRLIWRDDASLLDVVPDWTPVGTPLGLWTGPGSIISAANDDKFIITRLGLPLLPRCTATGAAAGGSTVTAEGLASSTSPWLTNQWVGYTIEIQSGPAQGQTRTVTASNGDTLNVSAPWELVNYPQNGDTFALLDTQRRDGYVREIISSAAGEPQDTICVGSANGIGVDALTWTPPPLWTASPLVGAPSPALANAGTPNSITSSTSLGGGNYFGRLIVITRDDSDNTHPMLGQVRYIVDKAADTLTVYPPWSAGPAGGNWSLVDFKVYENLGYFLVITSGRSAGRIFPITAYTPDAANGDHITCAGINFPSFNVRQARRNGNYQLQNADSFAIVGGPSSLLTVFPTTNEGRPYVLNSFGQPNAADRQTGADVTLQGNAEKETSEYSGVCILVTHRLAAGPVRADVFVWRNYDPRRSAADNSRAVGYMTGYIGRPQP